MIRDLLSDVIGGALLTAVLYVANKGERHLRGLRRDFKAYRAVSQRRYKRHQEKLAAHDAQFDKHGEQIGQHNEWLERFYSDGEEPHGATS